MPGYTAAEKAILARIAATARRARHTPERVQEIDALFTALRYARLRERLAEDADNDQGNPR